MNSLVVFGQPIGKPRQTQSDKWKQRKCVLAYRAWADAARLAIKRVTKIELTKPTALTVRAYFDGHTQHKIGPHVGKPDADNIAKAVMDALFHNDQMIYHVDCKKLWSDGGLARVEISWR